MNYRQIKELAYRADIASGKKRKRLVGKLLGELPKMDPFEGINRETVWFVKFLARVRWFGFSGFLRGENRII